MSSDSPERRRSSSSCCDRRAAVFQRSLSVLEPSTIVSDGHLMVSGFEGCPELTQATVLFAEKVLRLLPPCVSLVRSTASASHDSREEL